MRRGISKRNVVSSLLDHSTTQSLAAILAFTSLSAPISWYQDKAFNPYLILVIFALLLISLVFVGRRTNPTFLPPREESEYFFPFMSHAASEMSGVNNLLLSRKNEAAALVEHIEANGSKHCFLVGDSGVGKSILLREFFDFSNYGCMFESIVEYRNLFEQVHSRLVSNIMPSALEKVHGAYKTMMDDIDRAVDGDLRQYSESKKSIQNYIGSIEVNCPSVLVFEQAERALRMLKSSTTDERRYSELARDLISELRKKNDVHTLFVLRGDHAVEAIESLIDHEARPVHGRTFEFVSVFVLSGIQFSENSENYGLLRDRLVNGVGLNDYQLFKSALVIDRPTKSNAFIIQLTGYLLEHFSKTDPEVEALLHDPDTLPSRIVELYFKKLCDEYFIISAGGVIPASDARSVLYAVLFVLAEENRGTGRALTVDGIAGKSHLPLQAVENAVTFLIGKGVALDSGGQGQVRIAHDILAESIGRSDEIRLRADYKSIYKSFSEGGDHTRKPTEGIAQRNILVDLLNRGRPTVPQVFILICMLLCVFRSLWHQEALLLWKPINETIEKAIPNSIEDQFVSLEFYLPVMVTHFLWVSFMYKLDRAYFAGVLRNRGGLTRVFSATGAPLGALFGVILAFSPALFIVPILAGGSFLAIAYWLHSLSIDVNGPARSVSRELALKIGLNMVISAGATLVVYTLLNVPSHQDAYWWALSIIVFFCFCYIWYWFAMQPRQGSQEGWSTLLLMYDRGRQMQA